VKVASSIFGRSTVIVALTTAPFDGIAQTFNCDIPVPALKDQMISESIARYPGNCPCPCNGDARGSALWEA